nr:MAG TPA_asm: hypothetical protein [Caudoviricetes sp.]DAV04341.1 MAG TPA: hypothetical protein [Caudoviricetes sp.]
MVIHNGNYPEAAYYHCEEQPVLTVQDGWIVTPPDVILVLQERINLAF